MVAEGRISHGIDDERHITPPSTPAAKRVSLQRPSFILKYYQRICLQVKLQEDESEGSIFEARATLEDSRLF